jgi:hypothetical protein
MNNFTMDDIFGTDENEIQIFSKTRQTDKVTGFRKQTEYGARKFIKP